MGHSQALHLLAKTTKMTPNQLLVLERAAPRAIIVEFVSRSKYRWKGVELLGQDLNIVVIGVESIADDMA